METKNEAKYSEEAIEKHNEIAKEAQKHQKRARISYWIAAIAAIASVGATGIGLAYAQSAYGYMDEAEGTYAYAKSLADEVTAKIV